MVSDAIDLDTVTLSQAAAAIADSQVTSEELMAAVLNRARETEPVVHAYVYLDEDAAMEAARTADSRRADGLPCGPLHGVPVGIKDVFATADMPTAAGSQLLAGNRPTADAAAVQQLRTAGAVIVGKQWTHEFGCGMCEPPTRNPWDLSRYPGGSTVGGSVSVAVGSSLAALGADGGGSVRKPAAINGLVGLKPTWGRVSMRGIIPGSTTTDHVGWVTRSVRDSALMLQVLARDATNPPSPTPQNLATTATTSDGVDGIRIGCPRYFFQNLDPDIEACTRRCLDELTRAGATVMVIDLPELDLAPIIHNTLGAAESYSLHKRWLREYPHKYSPEVRRSLQFGAAIPGCDVIAAQRARRHLQTAMATAYANHKLDVICCPTLALPAMTLSEMDPVRMLPQYIRHTLVFNITGQPAISIPCGFSGDGMPVGVQIAGKPYDEAMVLRVARAVEATGLWTWSSPRLVL